MDVLDFPQVYQKPTFRALMDTLAGLEIKQPIWGHRENRVDILEEQESLISSKKVEVTRYLSTIIGSELAWIDDDDQKDQIWAQASKRMSERCGRTAMGDVIRRWPFEGQSTSDEPFELVIKEPALTGDSLGFKTWGSSYVLSRDLPRLATTSLRHLFAEGEPLPRVLELGSGTGLLGLAAAVFWRTSVALSDLPGIVPNLRDNAESNRSLVEARGGSLAVGDLTWGGAEDEIDQPLFGAQNKFDIVLVADPMYDDNHPALLASAISDHLALSSRSRAVVMVPQRDRTTVGLLESFKQLVQNLASPLLCVEEDYELRGQDDWVEDDEGGHVKCWLGIFSQSENAPDAPTA